MQREQPGSSDGVDSRYKDLVELAVGRVDVLGHLVGPRDPLAAVDVPEVVKQRRRTAGNLTWKRQQVATVLTANDRIAAAT